MLNKAWKTKGRAGEQQVLYHSIEARIGGTVVANCVADMVSFVSHKCIQRSPRMWTICICVGVGGTICLVATTQALNFRQRLAACCWKSPPRDFLGVNCTGFIFYINIQQTGKNYA